MSADTGDMRYSSISLEPLIAPELEFVLVVVLIILVWFAVIAFVILALSAIRWLF